MEKRGLLVLFTAPILLFSTDCFSEDVYEEDQSTTYVEEPGSYSQEFVDMGPNPDENIDYGSNLPFEDVYPSSPPRGEYQHQYPRDDSTLEYTPSPQKITGHGERVIIINPRVHTWGAYTEAGQLLRSGIASAGANWCADIGRSCRTRVGTFRIFSLGSSDCVSTRYPLGRGGAPMPYCMYFNGNQGLHGSNQVARANISHGCVRVSVDDAEWIRYNFATRGTKVVIMNY